MKGQTAAKAEFFFAALVGLATVVYQSVNMNAGMRLLLLCEGQAEIRISPRLAWPLFAILVSFYVLVRGWMEFARIVLWIRRLYRTEGAWGRLREDLTISSAQDYKDEVSRNFRRAASAKRSWADVESVFCLGVAVLVWWTFHNCALCHTHFGIVETCGPHAADLFAGVVSMGMSSILAGRFGARPL